MNIHRHNGEAIPCGAEEQVVVKFRNGRCYGKSERDGLQSQPVEAGMLRWRSWSNPTDWDIVAWRRAQ